MGEVCHFDGMTITLMQRKLCVDPNINMDLGCGKYLVLGHFDYMTIKHTDKWFDWAPYNTENISLEDEYMDKYCIKAYFPQSSQRSCYQKKKFDYDIWLESKDDYPFVIASVLNFSDGYVKSIKERGVSFCDAISELILECVQKLSLNEEWEEMHGAFFPTIGYSDIVMLFKTLNPKPVLILMEYMKQRKQCLQNSSKTFPNLSNTYTLLGICSHKLDRISETVKKDIKLNIRFGMKDGISTTDFKNYLEEVLGKNIGEYYKVLGAFDLMWVPNLDLKQILSEYFENKKGKPGIFHPQNSSFNYIRNMQTDVCIDLPISDKKSDPEQTKKNINSYYTEYKNLVGQLDTFLTDNRMPKRIVYGLQIVMKRYLQLIQSRHCFDVERIIGNAFSNFIECIKTDIEIVKKLNEDEKYEEIRQMFMAMNAFRERIGEYLADMQRSDSLFLEGRSLSHPSIGSATKLLLFYNGFIEKVKKFISTNPNERDRHRFVVTSGGTDQTQAIDLFSHLDPTDPEIRSVILVTVPEASLYDVGSSMFHVLHEMLHFCGNRCRGERWGYIVKAVAGYTANAFGDFFENTQKSAVEYTMEGLNAYIPDKRKEIENILLVETGSLKEQLFQLLNQKIGEKIQMNNGEENEQMFYSRNVYDCLYEILENLFYPVEREQTSLKYEIYRTYQNYQIGLFRKMQKLMEIVQIPYSNFTFIADIYEKKNRDISVYDKDDMALIDYIVGRYFGRDIELDEKYGRIEERDVAINLDSLLAIIENLFKECYADCMAGNIMRIEVNQFVMSFLSEARNEREAFSGDILARLRIMIDFEYLFKIKDSLSNDYGEMIDKYIKEQENSGRDYINTGKIIQWLDALISKKESEKERISAIINPVIEYLEMCKKTWENQGIDINSMDDIPKPNECIKNDNVNDSYRFLDYVTENWMSYAEE